MTFVPVSIFLASFFRRMTYRFIGLSVT